MVGNIIEGIPRKTEKKTVVEKPAKPKTPRRNSRKKEVVKDDDAKSVKE